MARRGGIRRRRLLTKPSCGPERLTAGECRGGAGRGRPTCGAATGSRERSSAMWGQPSAACTSCGGTLSARDVGMPHGWGFCACVPARVARHRRDDRHPWRCAVPAGRKGRKRPQPHVSGLSSCCFHVSFSFTSPRDRDAITPLSVQVLSACLHVEAGKLPVAQGSPCMFGLGRKNTDGVCLV